MRVAIVGGDAQNERKKWPKSLDLVFYQDQRYGGDGPLRALKTALSNRSLDVVVILTRWIGHPMFHVIRDHAQCRVISWPGGPGQLVREIEKLVQEQAA